MSEIRKYINLIESYERINESFKTAQEKFITQNDNDQEVNEYIEQFKELAKRNIIKGQDKDIGKWIKAGWESFKEMIDQSSTQQSKRQYKKKVKSDSVTIYEDNDTMVVIPFTEKASCYYGKNTRWCTAATNDNMFNRYVLVGRNIPFYVIKNGKKYACMYNRYKHSSVRFDCYDENDKSISISLFNEYTGISGADMIGWYNEYKDIIDTAFDIESQNNQIKEMAVRVNPSIIGELSNPKEEWIDISVSDDPKKYTVSSKPTGTFNIEGIIG